MPNLPAHIQLASQAASRLNSPIVNRHMGSFLLGSTSPDIRAMTKWPRQQTHFASLTVEKVGAGVEGMFRTHQRLGCTGVLNEPTQAFVAGYINHLVADECWILNVYYPYFDYHRGPGNQMQANIWDRAVQLDMDRLARIEMDNMAEVGALLENADDDVEVDFIGSEDLARWRVWVQEFNTWEFTWDRLHRSVRRMYGDDPEAHEMTQQFTQNIPDSLEQVYALVSPQALASYRETTIQASVKLIKEYMDASAGDRGVGGS